MVVECTVQCTSTRIFESNLPLNHRTVVVESGNFVFNKVLFALRNCVFVTNSEISVDQIIKISLFGCG